METYLGDVAAEGSWGGLGRVLVAKGGTDGCREKEGGREAVRWGFIATRAA